MLYNEQSSRFEPNDYEQKLYGLPPLAGYAEVFDYEKRLRRDLATKQSYLSHIDELRASDRPQPLPDNEVYVQVGRQAAELSVMHSDILHDLYAGAYRTVLAMEAQFKG